MNDGVHLLMTIINHNFSQQLFKGLATDIQAHSESKANTYI